MLTSLAIVSAISAAGIAAVRLGGRRAPAAVLCCPRHGAVMAVRNGQCAPHDGDVSARPLAVCPQRCLKGGQPAVRPAGGTSELTF